MGITGRSMKGKNVSFRYLISAITLVFMVILSLAPDLATGLPTAMATDNPCIYYAIWGTDSNNVFAAGMNGTVLRKYNDAYWTAMTQRGGIYYGIWGTSPDNFYVVGGTEATDEAVILKYNGIVFLNESIPSGLRGLRGIWGSSGNDITAIEQYGSVLHYNGDNWTVIWRPTGDIFLSGIWGSAVNDIFAVGYDINGQGIIIHYNGVQWSGVPVPSVRQLWSVWGSSTNNIFAVGNNSSVLHYDGNSWSVMSVPPGTPSVCMSVWGSSGTDVIVAGYGSNIIRYNGTIWSEIPSTCSYVSLWGTSGNDFYAGADGPYSGGYGYIVHYKNGIWTDMIPVPISLFIDNSAGASNIKTTSAQLNGDVINTGGENPSVRIYLGTTDGGTNPADWQKVKYMYVLPQGPFSGTTSGLTPNTTYYYRCWASNSAGTAWAPSTSSFTTLPDGPTAPTVTNSTGASNIKDTSAKLNGQVTSTGGENPEVHIYWGSVDGGTNPANWAHDENLGVKAAGSFSKDISGLFDVFDYYYRCFASNSAGSAWAPSSAKFITASSGLTRYEYFYDWDNIRSSGVHTTLWKTQTFTPSVNHSVERVSLLLYRNGTSFADGILTLSIRATDAQGLPTGSDLCTATINSVDIPGKVLGDAIWCDFYFSPGTTLIAGTQYAYVWRFSGGEGINWPAVLINGTNPTYLGGTEYYSPDSGTTWLLSALYDEVFEESGISLAITNGIGATNIKRTSVTWNGEIVNTGGENPSVRIYWGTTDGGPNPANWQKVKYMYTQPVGPFSGSSTGLTPNTKYYYRCWATNAAGTTWASTIATFTTLP
ncbi:MAG: fibronectin type III domain-containing protein [Dehalococcoidia bacterium]|nr:fibronectin type III domain-containing protein [Dehalococcoidia bacterium]MDD5493838.1 fibronectin type III domain-containing protein [Dehalococcoidia bacterium]